VARNLVLAFGEILVGAIILDAGIKGDSIANVVKGQATIHPLPGAGGSSSGGGGATGSTSGYVNPLPGAHTGRIDQGVDYTGSQFVAPGRSKVLIADAHNAGWKGGGYIAAQLLDGPLAGTVYYFAEGISPLVKAGETIAAGAPLGTAVANPYNGTVGNIEAGWADPTSPGRPLAQSLSGYSGDQSTQGLTAGYSFSRFVSALGGVAGVFQGAGTALAGAIEHEFTAGAAPGVPF
jgi:hypothetical protein